MRPTEPRSRLGKAKLWWIGCSNKKKKDLNCKINYLNMLALRLDFPGLLALPLPGLPSRFLFLPIKYSSRDSLVLDLENLFLPPKPNFSFLYCLLGLGLWIFLGLSFNAFSISTSNSSPSLIIPLFLFLLLLSFFLPYLLS